MTQDLFAGDGEMSAFMRQLDWSTTPVGAVETWAPSLQMAVRFCLSSGQPMEIFWGSDDLRFYNDAYGSMFGTPQLLQALGRPGRESWGETGEAIAPLLDRVKATGLSTQAENCLRLVTRKRFVEEAYFSFSYSPIRDERGRVAGVLSACSETTQQVLGQRRLQTLRELATRTGNTQRLDRACHQIAEALSINPADIPFALVYLLTADGERAELAVTVHLEAGAIASPQIIHLTASQPTSTWPLAQVKATGEASFISQCDLLPELAQSALILPLPQLGQTQKLEGFVILGISPRREFDNDYRGFFDLVASQITAAIASTSTSRETSRQQLSVMLERIADAFISLDRQWRYTYVNPQAARLLHKSPEELVGNSIWEVFPDAVGTIFEQEFRRSLFEQVPSEFEAFYPAFETWVEVRIYPSREGLSVYFRDITRRKLAAVRQQAQYEIARILAEAASLDEAVPALLRSLCESLDWQLGVIWSIDREANVLRCVNTWQVPNLPIDSFVEATQRFTFAPGEGLPGRIWASRQSAWIADISQDEQFQRAKVAREGDLRAAFGFPISRGGEILGTIECFSTRIQEPDADLLQMMAAVGSQIGQFIERQQIEAALRESQELFACFMENSPVTAFVKDEAGRYIYVNALAERLFNRPLAEWLGKTDFDLFPAEMAQTVRTSDLRILAEGKAQQVLEIAPLAEGDRHYLSFKFPFQDPSGRKRLAGMSLDVTERICAEAALQKAEERLRVALKNSPVAVFNQDLDLRYTWIYHPALAHNDQYVLGQRDVDLLSSEDAAILTQLKRQVIATGVGVRQEVKLTMEGQDWYYDLTVEPLRSCTSEGEIIGVTCAAVDITDRKQVEVALRQSETLLHALLASAPIGIAFLDRNLRYLQANEAIAAINGIPLSEHLGRTLWEILPDWAPLLAPVFQQVMETKAPLLNQEVKGETYPPGTYRQVLVNYYPVCLPDGQVLGVGVTASDVTELKRVEEDLEDALQKLTFHFENTPLAVIERDRDFKITRWSRSAEKIFGWTADETIGQDLQAVHADDVEKVRQVRARLIAGEENHNVSLNRSYTKTGEVIHCQWYNSALLDESGNLVSILSLVLDVTDRVRSEEAIKNSQERLALAHKIGGIGTCEWSLHTGKLIWTEELEALYGLAPGRFGSTYEDWLQLIHPDDRAKVNAATEQTLIQGIDFDLEFRILRPDASIGWIAAKAKLFNDATGKPLRLIGVNMDITERRRTEQALRESEQRFRIAQELSLDAFTILQSIRNLQGEIIDFQWTYANPKAAEIIGRSTDELIGGRLLQVLPGYRTQSELFNRYVRVVETGEPHDLEIYYDTEEITGWFRNMAVRINDGIAVSFSEITQRKQAEAERMRLLERERTARAEAEDANRIKDEFLAVLSHELRSPLNPILGWAKLLLSRDFDPETTRRALETIARNAKLQTQLIEDLLDVSRILRGKMALNVCAVDLKVTIEAAMETVRLAAETKSVQIRTICTDDVGQVLGDPSRLQQIVWNLLSNAVKFTPAQGHIEVHLTQVDDYAQIQVKDTGIGIAADFLPYVFDYFRQANSTTTRKFGGLGLGLAIVRYITELHGGAVKAESAGENLGATFTVRLPLMAIAPSPALDDRDFTSDPADLKGLHILVVDDEVDIRELVSFVLQQAGAEVTVATSAAEVMAALNQSIPDVLLSDIGMPEVDGYMLMRQVQTWLRSRGAQLKAIALTAYAGEYNQQQALSAGFQLHVSKPVEPEELVSAIARLVGKL